MVIGAFTGWLAVYAGAPLWGGVAVAALTGAVFGLLHAGLTCDLSGEQLHGCQGQLVAVVVVGQRRRGRVLDVLPQEQGVEHREAGKPHAEQRVAAIGVGIGAATNLPGGIKNAERGQQRTAHHPAGLHASDQFRWRVLAGVEHLERVDRAERRQAVIEQQAHEWRAPVRHHKPVHHPVLTETHRCSIQRLGWIAGWGVLEAHLGGIPQRFHRFRCGHGGSAGHVALGKHCSDLVIGEIAALEAVLLAEGLDVALGWRGLIDRFIQLALHPLRSGLVVKQPELIALHAGLHLKVSLQLEQVVILAEHFIHAGHGPQERFPWGVEVNVLRADALHPLAPGKAKAKG